MDRRNTRAFTIVELLVVIGIIAVLIGILVPVISSVRKSAYVADSRNQIQIISNAIERYHTDYQAYPGMYSNADLKAGVNQGAGGSSGRKTDGTIPGNLSSSEALFLSLCGGWTRTGTLPIVTYSYSVAEAGRGPLTFGVNQTRKPAYMEVTPQSASVAGSTLDSGGMFGWTSTFGTNVGAPEFIDRFPSALPIIYIRARVAAPAGTGPVIADTTGNLQYDTTELRAYAFDGTSNPGTVPLPGRIPTTPPKPVNDFASWDAYFTSTTLPNQSKRQDTYILISPGEDRLYGTADDICNFSF